MRMLLITALAITALALAGCGDDEEKKGGACANPESRECQECLVGLLDCAFSDACSEESAAVMECQNETGCGTVEEGEEPDPNCCPDENAAYSACFEEACSEYAACFDAFEG